MKIVVWAELVTDWGDTTTVDVARFDRPVHLLDPESIGLSLADDRRN